MPLLRDLGTLRVYQLPDLTNAQLIWPHAAFVAGKVNGGGKLDVVIESVRPDIKHAWPSTVPVPVDGAGGLPIT